jgi:hypothetical protein
LFRGAYDESRDGLLSTISHMLQWQLLSVLASEIFGGHQYNSVSISWTFNVSITNKVGKLVHINCTFDFFLVPVLHDYISSLMTFNNLELPS